MHTTEIVVYIYIENVRLFLLLLGLAVLKDKFVFYYFFTNQILGVVAADLLYKSVLGLCLIFSRAARFLPKPALNNIPSLCVYCDLYGVHGVNCKKFSMEVIECMKSTFAKLEFLLFLMKNIFIVLVPFAADVSFQLICHHRPEFVVRGPKR